METNTKPAPKHYALTTKIGKYPLLYVLGKGRSGTVWYSEDPDTNQPVAIKAFRKRVLLNPKEFQSFKTEIKIMKRLNHPNIVKLIALIEDDFSVNVVENCINGEDLAVYIFRHGPMSPPVARYVFKQIISALKYIQEKHIVHCDIKAENILLGQDFTPHIIDFGLADFTDNENSKTVSCGTPNYVSPEMWKGDPHGTPTDIWSAGVLLYYMVTQTFPFNVSDIKILMKQVVESDFVHVRLDPYFSEFMERMLDKNPDTRITVDEILAHPWMQGEAHPPKKDGLIKVKAAARTEIKTTQKIIPFRTMKTQKQKSMGLATTPTFIDDDDEFDW